MKKPLFSTPPTETKEYCAAIAKDFRVRSDLHKFNRHIFNVCKYNGWLDEFFPLTPPRPLDKESCRVAAANFNTRGEFYNGDVNAYNMSLKKGWMNEFFPPEIYDKERCREIASHYSCQTEFKDNDHTTYWISKKNGWLEEFLPRTYSERTVNEFLEVVFRCGSLKKFRETEPNWYKIASKKGWLRVEFLEIPTVRKLVEEECKKIASSYKTYRELMKGDRVVYEKCKSRGWLIGLGLIEDTRKNHPKYTMDEILEEARKYDNDRDFRVKCPKVYNAAKSRGLIESFTWMTLSRKLDQETYFKDFIYVYEFVETNVAYVGRTIQPEIRHLDHCKEGDSVADYARSIGVPVPAPKYLYENITVAEGRILEDKMIEKYRNDGWAMLNKRKGGAIGTIGKWGKSKCIEFCKQFTTRGEVNAANHTVYGRMLRNGWFDETPWIKKPYENGREHKGRPVLIYTPDGKILLKRCDKLKEAVSFAGCHVSTIQNALAGANNGVACGYLFKDGVAMDDAQREKFVKSLQRRVENRKTYREVNKGKRTERDKAYYETNKEKIAERNKAYRESNKEKIAASNKAYHEANKERLNAQQKAYRDTKKAAGYRYRKNPITGKLEWVFVGLPEQEVAP